jgi:hypothetical protein
VVATCDHGFGPSCSVKFGELSDCNVSKRTVFHGIIILSHVRYESVNFIYWYESVHNTDITLHILRERLVRPSLYGDPSSF